MNISASFGLTDDLWTQLPILVTEFEINTPLRMSHFLAQAKHESANFRRTEEGLYYTSVAAFRGAFATPSKDKSDDFIKQYLRNPEKLANYVYANRIGNGDEASGDGYRYRGRGYIQLTGRENYAEFNRVVPENILENPDLIKTKYALRSAGFFWRKNSINAIADRGTSPDVVLAVSQRVNGAKVPNGLSERKTFFEEFFSLANPFSSR
jgi:putative chitinase